MVKTVGGNVKTQGSSMIQTPFGKTSAHILPDLGDRTILSASKLLSSLDATAVIDSRSGSILNDKGEKLANLIVKNGIYLLQPDSHQSA